MEKRKSIINRFLIFGGVILVFFLGYHVFKEMQRTTEIEKEIEAQKKEAEKIRNNNKTLQEKIAYFETRDYKEKIAKDKFNFKKEGEEVVVIKPNPSVASVESRKKDIVKSEEKKLAENVISNKEKSNLIKWWNYFFKY